MFSNKVLQKILLILLLVIISLFFTGFIVDEYSNMESEYAQKYTPLIYISHEDTQPIRISYRYNGTTITYYIIWQDEKNPNTVVDFLYRVFRFLYYGSVLDIERVHVFIESNIPYKVVFETLEHEITELYVINGTHAAFKNGTIVQCLSDYRPILYVITWNHMFSITPHKNGNYSLYIPKDDIHKIKFHEYVFMKMYRRSTVGVNRVSDILSVVLLPIVVVEVVEVIKRCRK